MGEPIVNLLTPEEQTDLLAEMSDILFSNVTEIIDEIRSGWDGEDDPKDLFSIPIKSLSYIAKTGTEEEASQAIDFLEEIEGAISAMNSEQSISPEFSVLEAEGTTVGAELLGNSIFNDVDE